MGCCASTDALSKPAKYPCDSDSKCTTTKHGGASKSPPPSHPLLEEETVKEVLSEIPTVPKHPPPLLISESHQNQYPFIKSAPLLPNFTKTSDDKNHLKGAAGLKTPPFTALTNDEPSEEFSEICSTLSETMSVSASATENRETNVGANHEFRQIRHESPTRYKNRSFPGEVKSDKIVGRSPVRRPDPSPRRVRNGFGSDYGKRESGDSSGRRSRSPVTRTDSGPPPQSTRRTGKSPGWVGTGSGERVRKLDEGKESEEKLPPTSSELLENPLVSLECFIFL